MTYVFSGNIHERGTAELFEKLKKQIATEGRVSFETYRELADELVEEQKDHGLFDDNEDLMQMKRDLELKWKELPLEYRRD